MSATGEAKRLRRERDDARRELDTLRDQYERLREQAARMRDADARRVEYLYDHGLTGAHMGEFCVRAAAAIRDGEEPGCSCEVHRIAGRG